MRQKIRVFLLGTLAAALALVVVDAWARARSGEAMAQAAERFLTSLGAEQRAKAVIDFTDDNRYDFHFIPRERRGLPLKDLSDAQRKLAHALLSTGVSQRGLWKATTIMELEPILRELEKAGRIVRDPDLYYFTIFGTPGARGRWGWRVEGHHISLNFTLVNGSMVATAPSFFGANPAEVRSGERQGLRVLAAEEDLARDLMRGLDEKQRAAAIFDQTAPRDIVTMNAKKVEPLAPAGVAAAAMTAAQKALLKKLVGEYAGAMPGDLAAERLARVDRAGFDKIYFAWAGTLERGGPHYYRVQGPTFLIEYDNTQNDANHIHSVWRDFAGDFGEDLLREHYRTVAH